MQKVALGTHPPTPELGARYAGAARPGRASWRHLTPKCSLGNCGLDNQRPPGRSLEQGASGLGLEAQRQAVARHIAGGRLSAEFTEIESGKRNDRPQLATALAHAQAVGGVLIIAKLDRLARNVHFISGLLESGVDFVACDNPYATKLTIQILAAVAEHEREMISARTKAALAAAKARGVRLANPHAARPLAAAGKGNKAAIGALKASAAAFRARVLPIVAAIRSTGVTSPGDIAFELERRGIRTRRGGAGGERAFGDCSRLREPDPISPFDGM
jgi:DNA invertase Pin-like site-specific DNA recombinase